MSGAVGRPPVVPPAVAVRQWLPPAARAALDATGLPEESQRRFLRAGRDGENLLLAGASASGRTTAGLIAAMAWARTAFLAADEQRAERARAWLRRHGGAGVVVEEAARAAAVLGAETDRAILDDVDAWDDRPESARGVDAVRAWARERGEGACVLAISGAAAPLESLAERLFEERSRDAIQDTTPYARLLYRIWTPLRNEPFPPVTTIADAWEREFVWMAREAERFELRVRPGSWPWEAGAREWLRGRGLLAGRVGAEPEGEALGLDLGGGKGGGRAEARWRAVVGAPGSARELVRCAALMPVGWDEPAPVTVMLADAWSVLQAAAVMRRATRWDLLGAEGGDIAGDISAGAEAGAGLLAVGEGRVEIGPEVGGDARLWELGGRDARAVTELYASLAEAAGSGADAEERAALRLITGWSVSRGAAKAGAALVLAQARESRLPAEGAPVAERFPLAGEGEVIAVHHADGNAGTAHLVRQAARLGCEVIAASGRGAICGGPDAALRRWAGEAGGEAAVRFYAPTPFGRGLLRERAREAGGLRVR